MTTIRSATTTGAPFSLLDDRVEPAPTRLVTYRCQGGHVFGIRLYAEAEAVPTRWDCRACGATATTEVTGAVEVPEPPRRGASTKTPWQQLRERRSIAELEALLDERLALLRGHDRRESA